MASVLPAAAHKVLFYSVLLNISLSLTSVTVLPLRQPNLIACITEPYGHIIKDAH